MDGGEYGKSEKTISFMNRYFIFRKERNVNTEGMFKVLKRPIRNDDIIQMRIDDSNETDV
jgi:hypothetical protein